MVFIAFFILAFEIYSYYFLRPTSQTQQQQQTPQETETLENVPSLLLGTTREKAGSGRTLKVETPSYVIEVSSVGGRIVKVVDKTFGFDLITDLERKLNLYPLEVFTGNPEIDTILNFSPYEVKKENDKIVMKLSHPRIILEKTLLLKETHFELEIKTNYEGPIFISSGIRPFEDSFYTHEGPIIKIDGEVLRIDEEDIQKWEIFRGNIEFAGEESRYFFKGFKGKIKEAIAYKVSYEEEDETKFASLVLVSYESPMTLYAGAKYYSRIKDLGLSDLLDYGMLAIIVKPLFVFMYWVHSISGSWIASIVILTLIIRIIFFPLNYKSTVAMMKLQEVAPKIEKIRNKYKNDPVKMQEEMMKLYSEVGFNPMSGCLPILVQIPIFFALYKVLIITVDLKLSKLLWIPSLADKDPFYILPVIMGATMILQQKITPSPDKRQNMIMYISAVAFTFLFANFPSGLVLYWTVNNVLNIFQSYLIKKVLLKES